MAATPFTTSVPQAFDGSDIAHCVVDTDPPSSLKLPITLRIFFDPAQNLALFRFRIPVEISREPFFLDILPENIQSLSVCPPRCLHVRVAAVTLVGPRDYVRPATTVECPTLDALRLFARRNTMRILLPETQHDMAPFLSLCEAVSRGDLRPDPLHLNLQSLYRGLGARVVEIEELSALANPADLFSERLADKDEPPTYADLSQPRSPPSGSPGPAKKRRRLRTPSFSSASSSTPKYRTWKHLDLVVGEREKIMAELLRRATKKEKKFKQLLNVVDAKEARVEDLIAQLTEVIAKAEGVARDAGRPQPLTEQQVDQAEKELRSSQISTASAVTSPPPSIATSTSSPISDRVQTYVATQLDQLRSEFLDKYTTYETIRETRGEIDGYVAESVEQCVAEELERMLTKYVTESEMLEAVQEAVDNAVDEVRSRVLSAWE